MFSYDLISNEEMQQSEFKLLDPNVYNFEVKTAEYGTSKTSGAPMIKLMLEVYDIDGTKHYVFDNLIHMLSCRWKTRQFCESVGLFKEWEEKKFNETLCAGRCGRVRIAIEKEKTVDGKIYPPKNVVKEYVLIENTAANEKKKELPKNTDFQDDEDLPF